ncbi:MAG: NAD(P) transhydrogenase subunit alpha [Phycisphaerae bacterium]|nr:NAD(P) transhydrogenase subunit alpha [Phycisphaerae bacterium]
MLVGVISESFPSEHRVALVPAAVKALKAKGVDTLIERGAGIGAGFGDDEYTAEGARIEDDRAGVLGAADVVCQVRTLGANPRDGQGDLAFFRRPPFEQTLIGFCEPLTDAAPLQRLAECGVRTHAVELIPRTTRAQSMDALSSQAMIAGYKAALLAAGALPKLFPLMMTAAGTATAARVLVIGAGVAGLQAIATAKRLGAVVSGYDVRSAVKEEVESLGAKFLEIELPHKPVGDGRGGYAVAMDDAFYLAQRQMMTAAVAQSDVVITTAAVPGKRSPVLITSEMVEGMRAGAVIVDLAAERGGNCELTRADQATIHRGVTILGPTNLAATVPAHASMFYSRNLVSFILHMLKDGRLRDDPSDEIIHQTLLTRHGQIVHRRVREVLRLPPLQSETIHT